MSTSLSETAAAIEALRAIGNEREAAVNTIHFASGLQLVGRYEEAEKLMEPVIATYRRLGMEQNIGYAMTIHALALSNLGRFEPMRDLIDRFLRLEVLKRNERFLIARGTIAARGFLAAGEISRAVEPARSAAEAGTKVRSLAAYPHAVAAEVSLANGAPTEALELAKKAMEYLAAMREPPEQEIYVRWIYAEALHATGDVVSAKRAIGEARRRLGERAERIRDESMRDSFTTRVRENVRTLERAREWCDDSA